LGQIKLKKM